MNSHKREPIKHTCPDIDAAIKESKNHFDWLEKEFEELRASNDTLRKWGIEEAERVDELEKEAEELADTISGKDAEIADLHAQIAELQSELATV